MPALSATAFAPITTDAAGSTPSAMSTAFGALLQMHGMFAVVVRAIECAALTAAGAAAIGFSGGIGNSTTGNALAVLAPLMTALIATSTFAQQGLYAPASFNAPLKSARPLVFGWTLAVAIVTALAYMSTLPPELGRTSALLYVAGLACLMVSRAGAMAATRALRRNGYLTRNAIIYGSGGSSETLIAQLRADPDADVRICGIFDDRMDQRSAAAISDMPCLGDIEALKAFARSGRVDMLIMSLPLSAETRVSTLMQRVSELPLDVRMAASASTLRFHKSAYSYLGSVPVIDLCERPISGWSACAKWVFDKVIAVLAIVVLAPVMAAVALAVKLESKGPVIFRQKR